MSHPAAHGLLTYLQLTPLFIHLFTLAYLLTNLHTYLHTYLLHLVSRAFFVEVPMDRLRRLGGFSLGLGRLGLGGLGIGGGGVSSKSAVNDTIKIKHEV